ncbi:lysophospholipid acyltransferase family protein [Hymenobacter algoricola]|uniref:Phospholipid/glycerol acyltransferase domain-containing protein n=1 Tax=Hymenobacter algoricola TaxID=486267 RepID=A0ABP7N6U4_9BACT
MLFYTVMKPVVQVALRVFFRRLEIRHRERLDLPGPLLLVSNHPNTLMDPLVVAANRRAPISFLAKSTFFKNPVSKAIFTSGNCIPIYRRQDAESGDAGVTPEELAQRNEAAFGQCYDHFDRGGVIQIFPEGTSVSERRLRPLKTGAARICLGAEARHDFTLGVRILPIGINYFDPSRFRSDVFVNIGQPIRVADYAQAYHSDPDAAADALTEEIRRRLEQRLIITRDAAEDELVLQIERTFGEHLVPDDEETLYDNFLLSRTLLDAVPYFEKHAPARLTELRDKLSTYLLDLDRLRLTDEALAASKGRGQRWARATVSGLKLGLGLPLYLYGLLNNYLPYILPSLIARRATKDLEFVAPIMMVTGIITFGLSYAVQIGLVHHFTRHWAWTTAYALSLPLSGFYALSYWTGLQTRLRRLRALQLFRTERPAMEGLMRQRQHILRLLSESREAYLAATAVPAG